MKLLDKLKKQNPSTSLIWQTMLLTRGHLENIETADSSTKHKFRNIYALLKTAMENYKQMKK